MKHLQTFGINLFGLFVCFSAEPNPIALFPLDTTQEIADTSSMKHHPGKAFNAMVSEGLAKYFKSSLSFNGTASSFAVIPHSLELSQSFTILLWVFPESVLGPLVYYGTNASGIQIWWSDRNLSVILLSNEGSAITIRGPGLHLNAWNFVGVSYDFYKGEVVLSCYNELSKIFVTKAKVGIMELRTGRQLRLAATPYDSQHFKGRLACLQIYETSLSNNEVKHFRNRCLAKKGK